jgi:DNA-binding transcriptional ArsR family regulator
MVRPALAGVDDRPTAETEEPSLPVREPTPLEIHKALADDTRFRLYRYLGLSGRPVAVRELSTRLSLHPNTLRPHLRRLEEAGLVRREVRKGSTVGRPQTMYVAIEQVERENRDFRLLAEILAGLASGARARSSPASGGGISRHAASPNPGPAPVPGTTWRSCKRRWPQRGSIRASGGRATVSWR